MIRIGVIMSGVALLMAALAYYLILDGSLPAKSDYPLDLDRIRKLARAPEGALPTEIRMEMLARTKVPYVALRAGGGMKPAFMARATFQIITPSGDYVLEAGMDRDLAKTYGQDEGFNQQAWRNIQILMSNAAGIFVTHEHPDHIGGVVRHAAPESLTHKLYLTREQFAGLGAYAPGGKLPAAFDDYVPIDLSAPIAIAPGIVMIRAEGHTPGSVMFYVRLNTGREFLFVGDIAYTASNIIDGVDRPRLVRAFMVAPEDRSAVIHQLRALHALSRSEPGLVMIPSHADELLSALVEDGVIKAGVTARMAGSGQ